MKTGAITILGLLGSALCLYGASAVGAPEDKNAPEIVRTSCYMCHSTEGNNPDLAFIPRLAAQNAVYIKQQLKAFQDGSRTDPPGTIYMWPITQSLSDQQIDQVAGWFAGQAAPAPFTAGSQTEAGKALYTSGNLKEGVAACASCHGAQAVGNTIFPRLAGQNAQYLKAQLLYFRSGVRNDKNAELMKNVASHMSDDEMAAVSEYLSTL
jgi:cytochrome c553